MTQGPPPRYATIKPPYFGHRDDGTEPECARDENAELFFAPDNERADHRRDREHEARKLCATCPFVVTCALHGLEHEEYGLWGGLSEQDRPKLGGRGPSCTPGRPGGDHFRPAVMKRLARAGFSLDQTKAILLLWKIQLRANTLAKKADAAEARRLFERAFSGRGTAA